MEGCRNTCHRALPWMQAEAALRGQRSDWHRARRCQVISKRRGYRPPLGQKGCFFRWHIFWGPPPATVRHAYDAVGWNADPMPAGRSLSVRIATSPPAHRRCAFPANQLRLGTSLTPSLYAGLGENRSMDLIDLLLGRPLATEEEKAERIGPAKGIPIFGLDALSSAAYGPEAALTLLIPLGMAGVAYIVPISISIIFLLA